MVWELAPTRYGRRWALALGACLIALIAVGCQILSGRAYQAPAVTVFKLQMVSANTGWAVGFTGPVPEFPSSYVLRTMDAGQTWHRVSTQVKPERATFFLGRNDAWVLHWGSTLGQGILDFTTNAGQTWASKPVPGYRGGPTEIDFINAQQGWIAFCNNKGAQLLRTSDGGGNWLSVGPITRLGCPLSTGGSTDHIRFVSPEVGWAVADNPPGQEEPVPNCHLPEMQLLQTTDGGFSWHAVPLPIVGVNFAQLWASGTRVVLDGEFPARICAVAEQASAATASALPRPVPPDKPCPKPPAPPRVESTIAGLPIISGPCAKCGFVLSSQNSGRTWHVVTGPSPTSAVFFDARFGWFVAFRPAIYSTEDGGLDWTRVGLLPWVGAIVSVTSATTAWALGRNTGGGDCTPALWATRDGGRAWSMTNPNFSVQNGYG